jgi:hypothetical protein
MIVLDREHLARVTYDLRQQPTKWNTVRSRLSLILFGGVAWWATFWFIALPGLGIHPFVPPHWLAIEWAYWPLYVFVALIFISISSTNNIAWVLLRLTAVGHATHLQSIQKEMASLANGDLEDVDIKAVVDKVSS